MYGAGKVFWGFQLALDKGFIDDHLRRDVGEFTPSPRLYSFRIGSKFRCIRSTPTEMQSMSENDFECFASTGVNAPETTFPNSGFVKIVFAHAGVYRVARDLNF